MLKQGKKLRRQINKHWRVEVKGFVKSAGELGLKRPRFPRLSEKPGLRWLAAWEHEPTKIPFRVRWGYAVAILKAPGLARKGKLVEYIKDKWPGKADGLGEQGWVRYEKVAGFVRFKCRTRREAPGAIVQILVNDVYWDEKKALGILGDDTAAKEIQKLYLYSRIVGTEYAEAQQEYMALVKEAKAKEEAATKEAEKQKEILKDPSIAKAAVAAGKVQEALPNASSGTPMPKVKPAAEAPA